MLSHRVRTSRSNCIGLISTDLFWSTNSLLLLPFSIHVVKASRRCPEARIAVTILRRREIGSCTHAASNVCPNPWFSSALSVGPSELSSSFSGALTKDILLRTCCTAILTTCEKHMILLSLVLNEVISCSSSSFSKNSSILSFVVRLSTLQWPDLECKK